MLMTSIRSIENSLPLGTLEEEVLYVSCLSSQLDSNNTGNPSQGG